MISTDAPAISSATNITPPASAVEERLLCSPSVLRSTTKNHRKKEAKYSEIWELH
jgi:hypothetical protein